MQFAQTISQHVAALTQQHIVLRDDTMRSPAVMKLEAARLSKCYDAIEARLNAPRDTLLDAGFSAADISVGQAMYLALKFCTLEQHPKTAAWFKHLQSREAFQKSLPDSDGLLYTQDFYAPWDMPE